MIEQTKVCSYCGKEKALSLFHDMARSADGKQSWCASCRKGYDAVYWAHTRKRRRAQQDAWVEANRERKNEGTRRRRRRIAEFESAIPEAERRAFIASIGECQACGDTRDLTLDHVVPLDAGGIDDLSNAQVLCSTHNLMKGHKTIDFRKRWESQRERRAS